MKNELIQMRVTQEEKRKLQIKADKAGLSLSQYIINATDKNTDTEFAANLAKELCKLTNIINKIENEEVLKELRERSEKLWQLLKLCLQKTNIKMI